MNLGIAGKPALVTTSSAGMGRNIAHALAAEGVNVALFARSTEKLKSGQRNHGELSCTALLDTSHRAGSAAYSAEQSEARRKLTPLGRMGTQEEITGVITFWPPCRPASSPDRAFRSKVVWSALWSDTGHYSSTISKSALVTEHAGQIQSSGTSAQRVPGGMPSSGVPALSS